MPHAHQPNAWQADPWNLYLPGSFSTPYIGDKLIPPLL